MRARMNTRATPGAAALHPAKGLFGFLVMLVAALLAAAALFAAAEAGAQTTTTSGLLSGKIVVIDPGHGGSDLGATYKFPSGSPYANIGTLTEKHQNLDVAYKLRKLLRDQGATVFMTREGDQNLTNTQRAQFANEKKADLLVSIHMNGSKDPKVDYTTTLFGKWQKDKAFAYAIFGDNVNPPGYGLRTLRAAPEGTQGYIATRAPYSYASGVLLKSNMPATIAETVFMTNTGEANWLAKSWNHNPVEYDPYNGRQQQIAEALKAGVMAYRFE
jgi:N-acetylmuramoyl-L-alanine amidase